MSRVVLLFLAVTLIMTGCLRSTVVVKRASQGRLAVEHTILFDRDGADMLTSAGVPEATIDSLFNGTANVAQFVAHSRYMLDSHYAIRELQNVTTTNDAGFRIIAEVERAEYFTPNIGELLYSSLPKDTTIVTFADSNDALVATVHPRAFVAAYEYPTDQELNESDIRQFAMVSTFIKGLTFDLFIDHGGSADTVIQFNARAFTDVLNTNDDVARTFLTIAARTDQEIIDFLASFPDTALRVPQITRQAVAPKHFTVKVPPPPTKEERVAALLERLSHNTNSLDFLTVMPSVLAMRRSEVKRDTYRPLPWKGPLDTLITSLLEVGAVVRIDSTDHGRTLVVYDTAVQWRTGRYELIEHKDHGLIDAVVISWPASDPNASIDYARDRVLRHLEIADLTGEVVRDTPNEYRVRYRDQNNVLMEQYLKLDQESSSVAGATATLRVGRRVVLP